MMNKAFSQLTDAEKVRKLDIAIRNHTDNLLTADQIKSLMQDVSTNHQYTISVHPIKCESCEALVIENVIHIFVPERLHIGETRVSNGR